MSKRRRDQGPDLFAWADAQPAAAETAAESAPVLARMRTPDRQQADVPAVEVSSSEIVAVVNFRERRETLPRFILHPMRDLDRMDRWIDRKAGRIPPAPILPFAPRPP